MLYLIQDNQKVLVNKNVQDNQKILVNKNTNITVTDKYIIKHNGFNIAYAQCRITGKFVKHILAKNELMLSSIERYKTMLVLLLCVSANIISLAYMVM